MTYQSHIAKMGETIAENGAPWGAIDAASAALASPSVSTSRKSSGLPAPPEAITGIFVARDTAR